MCALRWKWALNKNLAAARNKLSVQVHAWKQNATLLEHVQMKVTAQLDQRAGFEQRGYFIQPSVFVSYICYADFLEVSFTIPFFRSWFFLTLWQYFRTVSMYADVGRACLARLRVFRLGRCSLLETKSKKKVHKTESVSFDVKRIFFRDLFMYRQLGLFLCRGLFMSAPFTMYTLGAPN